MRSYLVSVMKPLHAVAIENHMRAGTPDINYIDGWIECKWLQAYPKNINNSIRFKHTLTQGQKLWLCSRAKRGGVALVCCKISKDWYVFDAFTAYANFDKMNKEDMIEKSIYHSIGKLDKERFLAWLRSLNSGSQKN